MYGMILLEHMEIQRHTPGHEINVREAQMKSHYCFKIGTKTSYNIVFGHIGNQNYGKFWA